MAIRTNTTDEEVDATSLLDHLLIVLALSHQVGGISVQDVDVLLRTVDMIEEVAGHESVITLRMRLRQTYILVHVEGDHVLERYLTGTISLDEGVPTGEEPVGRPNTNL